MYTLFIMNSYYIRHRRFDSIAEAKAFFEELKLGADYVVTIESINLPSPIILQGA